MHVDLSTDFLMGFTWMHYVVGWTNPWETRVDLPAFDVEKLWHVYTCKGPKIAKLVNITPITMVYGIYNYSYWGESKPTNISWGPHIVHM